MAGTIIKTMPKTRPSGSRREVSSGGVVFRRTAQGAEFVLIRANGRWLFPKGNVEKGESPEAAALREISEETGLDASGLRIVRPLPDIDYVFRWEGRLIFKRVHNFLVEAADGLALRPQLSEIEEVRWFGPGAARRTLSFRNSQGVLEAAIAAVQSLRVA